MVKLQKEEYTVGWICALPVPEWQASRLLFDVEHEDADLGPNVSYQYAFGEINRHNVVMGCLPDAQPGVGTAASVATEMRLVFPSLRFGLLVGIGMAKPAFVHELRNSDIFIGGGVPSKDNDIRLGDVVVSRVNKDGRHGGVVHYDYGKYVQEGEFQPTGMLNKPPPILSSALGKVRSARPTSSKFYEYLDSFQKCSDYAPQFSSPPKLDQLFEASFVHPAKELTCSKCSVEHEVSRAERPGRPVKVHYGTIASGNQVIKDAGKRDLINSNYQDDILCFEMEAAGLVDHLQCIVIRGISDYCDSHKNKSWQPFASASAAAWAKELLRNITPAEAAKLDAVSKVSTQNFPKTTIMLPYGRDKHFVGREAVFLELDSTFADVDAHSRIGIVGLGGVGKSQVVTEYAYRLQQSQPDTSIFWVHASSRERFRNDYQSIATKLQLQGFDDLKADHLGIVFDWLQSPASGKWLVILDNADSKDLTSSWHAEIMADNDFNIPRYLPRKAGSAIIVTSRDTQAAFDLVGDKERIIKLEAMTESEAVQLFRSKTRLREWDPVQAHRLSAQLDCIPLAITQAAAYIMARERMTIAAYLELFQQEEERLLSTSENDLRRDVNVPNAVIKTWEISFHQIQKIDEAAIELLFRMCFLSRYGIPTSLLEKASPTRQKFDEALETLMRFSFVDSHSDEPELLKMHRLVQKATKTWIQMNHELAKWCFESLKLVWIRYPDDEFTDWESCRLLEPHAESVVESSLQHWQHWLNAGQSIPAPLSTECIVSTASGTYDTPYTPINARMMRAGLLFRRAKYAHRQARLAKAIAMAERAMEDSDCTFGRQHAHSLGIGSFLAVSFLHAGNLERAERLSSEIVDLQRQIYGDEHPDTLVTLCTLAMTYRELGSLGKAEDILSSIIWMHECGLVTDEESLIMTTNDLAIVYGDQGQWKKKERLEQANLRRLMMRQGPSHPDTLSIQQNLAVSMQKLGHYKESGLLFKRAFEGKKRVYGENHPLTIISMGHLADVYFCQNRQIEAFNLHQEILDRRKRADLAETHPTVLRSMSDVALYYHISGRLEESYRLQQHVFSLYQRACEETTHGTTMWHERQERLLLCQERLAKVLNSMQRHQAAREELQACVDGKLQFFGEDHSSTIKSRRLLSDWHMQDSFRKVVRNAIYRVRDSLLVQHQAIDEAGADSTLSHVRTAVFKVRDWLFDQSQTPQAGKDHGVDAKTNDSERHLDADIDEAQLPSPFDFLDSYDNFLFGRLHRNSSPSRHPKSKNT